MTLHEPMTLVTDYALGALCAALAIRMRGRGLPQNRADWAAALSACAVAAFAGGTYHGFLPHLDERLAAVLWRLTLLAIGWAAYAAVTATCRAHLAARQRAVIWAGRLQAAAYALAAIATGEFLVAIINYSLAFAFVLAVHLRAWHERGDRAALTVVCGVLTSFLAAGIQAAGIAPHESFNHNDLYHVVQMAGTALLYRGALRSQREGSRAIPASRARPAR